MKNLRFLILFIPFASAVIINCEFKTYTYSDIGSGYECKLNKDPSITSPNIVITSAKGTHQASMSHEKVTSFYSWSKIIHYIPYGLNKIFPNLFSLFIANGRIKEIHQKDLEQYPRLVYLTLYDNDITYLEKDLFKFNTELKFISFNTNKINQIYPKIFDHLKKLEHLHLDVNQCVDKREDDRSGVLELIKETKDICWLFTIFDRLNNADENINLKLESIKNQFNEKSLMIENMVMRQNEKLQKFETNLCKNKSITDDIQNLMKQQEKSLMTKLGEQCDEMNQKLVYLEKSLFQQFLFIGLPLICLLTSFNIAMIYLCCRKEAKISKR